MQMRPALQIQSVLKALTDVVLPAVDPQNKLAQEQARLIVGMLNLMQQQLPLQFRFDCDELRRLIAFSRALHDVAQGGSGTTEAKADLDAQTRAAAEILERAQTGPDAVEHAVRTLRAASGELITQVFGEARPASRDRVREIVLDMSREQLLRDRAWVRAQGWEPDPNSLPSVESLI